MVAKVFIALSGLVSMDDTIEDITSELVTPLLIYFGNQGITPCVMGVEGGEVLTLEMVPGHRLGELLRQTEFSSPVASAVYRSLGTSVGTISRHGVMHGHLHSDNVVVTPDNKPVIIDWGQASYLPIVDDPKGWYLRNCVQLVEDVRHSGRGDREQLERTLMDAFDQSVRIPLERSYREIELAVRNIMYHDGFPGG